jgi:hypothetical protein
MKKLMFCILVLMAAAVAANAARTTFNPPIYPVPCDTSARPDSFGYAWVDNDNGGSPNYEWRNITNNGVHVQGLQDDNVVGPISLGFIFPYYWYTVDHLYIGSNGYISFTDNDNYSQEFAVIPSSTKPNNIVAPLAGDLDFTRTSSNPSCYYYTNNVDTFIISWINVREWPVPNDPDSLTSHTFQMILCKNDSSITFQYGAQVGTFDNSSTPGTHSCQTGIEDLIGRTGLNYMSDWTPTAQVPHDGLIVRIHPIPRPGFIFHDAGIFGGMNATSGAELIKLLTHFTPKALVKNFGTANESNIIVNCNIKKGLSNFYNKSDTLATLAAGEEAWAIFPDTFMTVMDIYSAIFRTTLTGDQFATNNRDTSELCPYQLPGIASYVDSTIQYSSWQGGHGGWANEFVLSEAIKVTSFQTDVMMDNTFPAYLMLIQADANGDPDMNHILWTDTIQVADTNWITTAVNPPIDIAAGQKFFAAVIAESTGLSQGTDNTTPLSNRGWEYTTSFAVSRDRNVQDICIKLGIAVGSDIDNEASVPVNFSLRQNYPNPFNANTQIAFDLVNKGKVSLDIFNIAGQKIKTLVNESLNPGHHALLWDGTNDYGQKTASGVYFYKLQANNQSKTLKMVMLK